MIGEVLCFVYEPRYQETKPCVEFDFFIINFFKEIQRTINKLGMYCNIIKNTRCTGIQSYKNMH